MHHNYPSIILTTTVQVRIQAGAITINIKSPPSSALSKGPQTKVQWQRELTQSFLYKALTVFFKTAKQKAKPMVCLLCRNAEYLIIWTSQAANQKLSIVSYRAENQNGPVSLTTGQQEITTCYRQYCSMSYSGFSGTKSALLLTHLKLRHIIIVYMPLK